MVAVPGKGIVSTLYHDTDPSLKQLLFWDQALDRSIQEHEARCAGDLFQPFAETVYPPRGLAVTLDNHLVVVTAETPGLNSGGAASEVVIMTMKGDVIQRRTLDSGSCLGDHCDQYFPRFVNRVFFHLFYLCSAYLIPSPFGGSLSPFLRASL